MLKQNTNNSPMPDINHIIDYLASLHTPEKDVLEICKKYADLLSDEENIKNLLHTAKHKMFVKATMLEKIQAVCEHPKDFIVSNDGYVGKCSICGKIINTFGVK